MFYKLINSELVYGNFIYGQGYTLTPADQTAQVDGWKWFNSDAEAMALRKYISPTDPVGLTSESFLMFGLGSQVYITPMTTGNIKGHIKYIPYGVGAYGINQFKLVYGSGTAPENAAAATGTVIGSIDQGGSVEEIPYTPTPIVRDIIVTGLTLGVQYWFDIQCAKFSNNAIVGIKNIEVILEELN
jgi:hypothetical protein